MLTKVILSYYFQKELFLSKCAHYWSSSSKILRFSPWKVDLELIFLFRPLLFKVAKVSWSWAPIVKHRLLYWPSSYVKHRWVEVRGGTGVSDSRPGSEDDAFTGKKWQRTNKGETEVSINLEQNKRKKLGCKSNMASSAPQPLIIGKIPSLHKKT